MCPIFKASVSWPKWTLQVSSRYSDPEGLITHSETAEGRTTRAQCQVALGVRLAQAQGMLASDTTDQPSRCISDDERAIVWTLFMLDRVFIGAKVSSATVPSSAYQLSLFQHGPQLVSSNADAKPIALQTSLQSRLGKVYSILSTNVEVLQIWEQVVATSFQATTDISTPFWKDGSALSQTLSSLLEFELSKVTSHIYNAFPDITQRSIPIDMLSSGHPSE